MNPSVMALLGILTGASPFQVDFLAGNQEAWKAKASGRSWKAPASGRAWKAKASGRAWKAPKDDG